MASVPKAPIAAGSSRDVSRITYFTCRWARSLPAGAVMMLGGTVILGWFVRAPALVQVLPQHPAMTLGTACCFLLTGAALLVADVLPQRAAHFQAVAGWMVLTLAGVVVAEHIIDRDLGVDLPSLHAWLSTDNPRPGRMAISTAFVFMLSGASLVLMRRVRGRMAATLMRILILIVIVVGVVGIVGYALAAELIYTWYGYSSMALHTAIGVTLIGVALLLSVQRLRWYREERAAAPGAHIVSIGTAWLAVVAFAAGITGFVVMQQRAERSLSDTLLVALHHRIQLFESLISLRVANATLIGTRPAMLGHLRALAGTPDDTQGRSAVAEVAASFLPGGFSAVAIFDLRGNEVARSGQFTEHPDLAVPLNAPQKAELLWHDGFILRTRTELVDRFGPVGSAIAEQPLTVLTRSIDDVAGLGATGDSGICALQAGSFQCFPQRLHKKVLIVPARRDGKPLPMALAFQQQTGVLQTTDYRGKSVIAAYGLVGTFGLGMSLKVDAAEIYLPVRERLQVFVPLLLALVVAGAFVLRVQTEPLVGELVRSRETLHDRATELQRVNAELKHASSAKDGFLASMSHELRTPLNGIIGFSELLADELPGKLNDTQKEFVGEILNGGRHLLQLINDLLDLSKVEAGKMELSPETFALPHAVEEVSSVVSQMAQKKNIALRSQLVPTIDNVTLDRRKFKQVLFNLLSNAVKFTEDGGRVDVTMQPHGHGQLRIQVRDTGIGIKREDLGKLFAEFQQIDSSLARRHGGTGLGLALTKKIVELQNGSISVESEPGKGSTFTVVLPLGAEEALSEG